MQTLDVLNSLKKLCDVRSEIRFVRRNIVSTGQSAQALKKVRFRLAFRLF